MKIKTYIIKTEKEEFYCGKTNNIKRRIKEHRNEKKPSWFGFKDRKRFNEILIINGDYEREVKRFGVKKFYELYFKEMQITKLKEKELNESYIIKEEMEVSLS